MNKKIHLLLIVIFLLTCGAHGQPAHQKIMQPVNDLFKAMRTNDSTLARSVFTEDAVLYTVFQSKEGQFKRTSTPLDKLVIAFGKPKEATWKEPIWNERVAMDGGLATVWVDYAFYLGDQFSHCGVDAFQLEKTPEGWKIFILTDTRRQDCNIPGEIQKKYGKVSP